MTRAVLSMLLLSGCGSAPPAAPARIVEPRVEPPAAQTGAEVRRAGLVVVVVIDQLPTAALETYLPYLSEEGAIRQGITAGAFHRHVVYPYAGTYTAPGHAAIFTGAPPAESGVVSNEVYDYARAAQVASVDDGEHAVLGVEGAFASPEVLRADTVADSLADATEGRGIVASVSFKDRAAILGGGHRPDLVLWYEKAVPGFTTSTYYADALPGWLGQFLEEHPAESMLTEWTADDPALYERVAGPDRAPGEGDWHGLGVVFPHDPRASDAPYSVVRATPDSTVYLLALASEVARRMELGRDEVPDLLAISISAADYAGHVFGWHSWEYADNLIKADRALGALLAELGAERGPIAVLITSDHGAAVLPERLRAEGASGGRLDGPLVMRELEAALDRRLGRGDYVAAFVQPFVYLSEQAREPARRARVVAAITQWLGARPEIEAAFDAREAVRLREDDDPLKRAVGLSIPDGSAGDVFVVPAHGYVVDEEMPEGYGTSHGTPWDYDQNVPVVFWGPGVEHVETSEPLSQRRVATTIASLLRVPRPSHADPDPLPGAPP